MDVSSLPPVENLIATQRQIEKDLSLLMDSFDQLKGAIGNFSTSLRLLSNPSKEQEALVPLTTSVYVDAVLEEPERVLIDVGTGYYIEQPVEDAKEYFKGKVTFLTSQLDQLQPVLNEKKSMISVLSSAIQQKLQSNRSE